MLTGVVHRTNDGDGMDSKALGARLRRAQGKTKRRLLRAPVVRAASERGYRRALQSHADRLRDLVPDYPPETLESLRSRYVASVDTSTVLPEDVADRALELCDRLSASPTRGPRNEVSIDEIVDDFRVWEWGMSDANLDLTEWYLGLPIRYLGVNVKRERADSTTTGCGSGTSTSRTGTPSSWSST